jgi:hypothetical protein
MWLQKDIKALLDVGYRWGAVARRNVMDRSQEFCETQGRRRAVKRCQETEG